MKSSVIHLQTIHSLRTLDASNLRLRNGGVLHRPRRNYPGVHVVGLTGAVIRGAYMSPELKLHPLTILLTLVPICMLSTRLALTVMYFRTVLINLHR